MNTLTVIALLAASIHPFGKQPSEPLRADSISIYYSDETQPEKCDEGMTIEEFLSESTAPRFPDAYSQPYDSLVVALQERRRVRRSTTSSTNSSTSNPYRAMTAGSFPTRFTKPGCG